MSFITWEDSQYSVGISFIDKQHKQLVGLINALHVYQTDKSDTGELDRIINTLIQYTENHFSDEEQFLSNIGYSELESHKEKHDNFVKLVKEFQEDIETEVSDKPGLVAKLLESLKNWLTLHILKEDMAYKEHMLKGISAK